MLTWLSRKIWILISISSLSNFWNLVLPKIFKALTELRKYPSFLKIMGKGLAGEASLILQNVRSMCLLDSVRSSRYYWAPVWIENEFKVILSWPFLIAIFISPYEVAGEFLDYLLNSGWELLFISCQIESLGDNSPLCECHGYSLVFCL